MFNKLHSAVIKWRDRSELARELYAMTDRDLADIGINVTDIPRVLKGEYDDRANVQANRSVPGGATRRKQMSGSMAKVA